MISKIIIQKTLITFHSFAAGAMLVIALWIFIESGEIYFAALAFMGLNIILLMVHFSDWLLIWGKNG